MCVASHQNRRAISMSAATTSALRGPSSLASLVCMLPEAHSTCVQQGADDAGSLKLVTVTGEGSVWCQPQRRGAVPLADVPLI